jgi:hypothetical protein
MVACRATHFGATLLLLALGGCGSSGTAAIDGVDGKTGGAGTGAAANDSADSGGAASGGAASGGTASGGASSGGSGSGGTGAASGCFAPDSPPPSGQCRQDADCFATLGGKCMIDASSVAGVCGACFASPAECTSDPDCDDGEICVTGPANSCQCMGPGMVCTAACTSDSCESGMVCGDNGHCLVASCVDDGFTCPTDSVCDPERTGDAHGCTPALCDSEGFACASDTVCDPSRPGDSHGCAALSCETEGYVCPESMTCDPATTDPLVGSDAHGCRLLHCTEGKECGTDQVCGAASTTGDGCVRRSCESDSDCESCACVFGSCQDHLFICVALPS